MSNSVGRKSAQTLTTKNHVVCSQYGLITMMEQASPALFRFERRMNLRECQL
jgi:hypothetical protein